MSFDDLAKEVHAYINGFLRRKDERIMISQDKFESMKVLLSSIYFTSPKSHLWRPLTLLKTAESFGVSKEVAMPYAAALEFKHSKTLVYDDLPCMDNADTRRGQESCHKKWGEDIAVLCGYYLGALSYRLVAEGKGGAEKNVKIASEYAIASENIAFGQEIDLRESEYFSNLGQVDELYRLKTGVLFSAAAVGGAILGGATDEELEIYRRVGVLIGLMYQAGDDIYDRFAEKEDLGKPIGYDKGKTLPDIVGKERSFAMRDEFERNAIELLENMDRDNSSLIELIREIGGAFKEKFY